MNTTGEDSQTGTFERAVKRHFLFLEREYGFHFTGVRKQDADPRDAALVASYRKDASRIQVAWSLYDGSAGVGIYLDLAGLRRQERYVHLEPFVEFISRGVVCPIVPQVYPGMRVARLQEVVKLREEVARQGVDRLLESLAARLHEYYPVISEASSEAVREYHGWYQTRGAAT